MYVSNRINNKAMATKRKSKQERLLERVNVLLKEVSHVLPLDVSKVPNGQCTTDEVFELEDGMNLIYLSETDYEAQHPKHIETVYGNYEDLPTSDLAEIVRILEDVSADCYKAMKRCES
jgi:hypothetical protein